MNPQLSLYEPGTFTIAFQEKTYHVKAFNQPGGTIYRIDFVKSCLFLTKFETAKGERYWTAVPEDTKINHLVQELGITIEKTLL